MDLPTYVHRFMGSVAFDSLHELEASSQVLPSRVGIRQVVEEFMRTNRPTFLSIQCSNIKWATI